ncbi:MAG: 4Fe-4S binding protein, partial [candidate division WOR-3 bacterium]
ILTPEKCIVCYACQRDCPAEAIEITTVNEAEKKYKMVIHNDRCVHCEQCAESCPVDAIKLNTEFELATLSRWDLKAEYIYTKASPAKK